MPNLNARISKNDGLVLGDDFDVTRPITDLPSGVTISKAYFTVKSNESDLDAAAIFQKTITSVLDNAEGQITDTGADGTGSVTFYLQAADTVLMTADVEYVYDIQLVLSNARLNTPEKGLISGTGQVTRATS